MRKPARAEKERATSVNERLPRSLAPAETSESEFKNCGIPRGVRSVTRGQSHRCVWRTQSCIEACALSRRLKLDVYTVCNCVRA